MGLEYNLIIILLLYLMLLLLLAMMIFFLMPSLRKLSNIMGLSFSIDRSTCGEVSHFFCHVIKSRKVKFDWSMLQLRALHYTVFMPLQVKDGIFCKIGKAGEPKTSYLVMF